MLLGQLENNLPFRFFLFFSIIVIFKKKKKRTHTPIRYNNSNKVATVLFDSLIHTTT